MGKYIELTFKKGQQTFKKRIFLLPERSLWSRIKTIPAHYKHGVRSKYPRCCILKFCLCQIILNNYFTNLTYPYSIDSSLQRRLCIYHFIKELLKGKIKINNRQIVDRAFFLNCIKSEFKKK